MVLCGVFKAHAIGEVEIEIESFHTLGPIWIITLLQYSSHG